MFASVSRVSAGGSKFNGCEEECDNRLIGQDPGIGTRNVIHCLNNITSQTIVDDISTTSIDSVYRRNMCIHMNGTVLKCVHKYSNVTTGMGISGVSNSIERVSVSMGVCSLVHGIDLSDIPAYSLKDEFVFESEGIDMGKGMNECNETRAIGWTGINGARVCDRVSTPGCMRVTVHNNSSIKSLNSCEAWRRSINAFVCFVCRINNLAYHGDGDELNAFGYISSQYHSDNGYLCVISGNVLVCSTRLCMYNSIVGILVVNCMSSIIHIVCNHDVPFCPNNTVVDSIKSDT